MAASNVYRREVFQDIASAPGSSYAASGWIQTSGLAGAAEIRVLWLNAAGQTIRTDVVGSVTGTSPWTFASVTLNAPPNTHTARFWTQIPPEPDGAGFAWFDDLTFNGVPVANPPLTDPGFENNGQGWQRTTNGGRSIVNTQSHSGSFSQEMTAHPQWTREVDQDIRVQAGSPNTVSGWIKTANLAAGASIRVLWLDGAGSTIHPDTTAIVSGTQPWTYVTGTFTAPAGTVSARVRLFLAVEPDGAGSAWFDDIGFQ
jgi:hypothetical protein